VIKIKIMAGRAEIPGSTPVKPASGPRTALAPDHRLAVSIILKSPSESDVAALEAFAHEYGLQVTEADPAKRTVKVTGTAENLSRAFGVDLGVFGNYIGYEGPITVPDDLAGCILAVLGFDNRPIAHHQ
jgi:Pro-kumamolisin, activation domain